jgi:hypothetical protein
MDPGHLFRAAFTQMLSSVRRVSPPPRRDRRAMTGSLSRVASGSILAAALLLAACSSTPAPKPAMVPISANGNYGYDAVMLTTDEYRVSYMTPRLKVPLNRVDRDVSIASEKQRAHDFAFWHAAELGHEKGFTAMKQLNDHTDTNIDTNVRRDYGPGFYGFYGYGYGSYRHYPGGFGPVPWFPGDYPYDYGPGGYYYERTTTNMRVNSRLDIKFFKTATDQAQSIDAVIEEMTKKYNPATYP